MISLYRQYYKDKPQNMRDLAYTLAHRREHLRYRSFFVISSFSLGETSPLTEKSKVPNIVLVFSGQGAQWLGMAASLMKNDPSFREDIAAMDKMLQNLKYKPEWHIEGIYRVSIAAVSDY
jgi:acyl transferase domain-containing protein